LYYVTQLSNYSPLLITEIAATIPDAYIEIRGRSFFSLPCACPTGYVLVSSELLNSRITNEANDDVRFANWIKPA